LLQSTPGISAQQPFAVASDKEIRFTVSGIGYGEESLEPYTKPHFHDKGGTFFYALNFFKV
jgi:hypothetical protein